MDSNYLLRVKEGRRLLITITPHSPFQSYGCRFYFQCCGNSKVSYFHALSDSCYVETLNSGCIHQRKKKIVTSVEFRFCTLQMRKCMAFNRLYITVIVASDIFCWFLKEGDPLEIEYK